MQNTVKTSGSLVFKELTRVLPHPEGFRAGSEWFVVGYRNLQLGSTATRQHHDCEGKALPAGKVLSVGDEGMEIEAVLSDEAKLPYWRGTSVA